MLVEEKSQDDKELGLVRGFLSTTVSLSKTKEKLTNLNLKGFEYNYFSSINKYTVKTKKSKTIVEQGFFFNGLAEKTFPTKSLKDMFGKILEEKKTNEMISDISSESEDQLLYPKKGKLTGHYMGIRIKPPYDIKQIDNISKEVTRTTLAHDVLLRTVEHESEKTLLTKPLLCMDILTRSNPTRHQNNLIELFARYGYIVTKFTHIELLK